MLRNDFDYIVVEKGEFDIPTANKGLDVSKYRHIEIIPYSKSFVFPHVDSCLGVIIHLDNYCSVVAHLGMFDLGFDDKGELKLPLSGQLDDILKKMNDKLPTELILVGDATAWDREVDVLSEKLFSLNQHLTVNRENYNKNFSPGDIQCYGKKNLQFIPKDYNKSIEEAREDYVTTPISK